MCGGKIFKTFWAGLSVGKVRSVCVSLQRNCLPSYGHLLVVVSFSTLAGNVGLWPIGLIPYVFLAQSSKFLILLKEVAAT
jgi:hypothetical protein